MVMQRWDPFGDAMSLRSVMDRLFEDAWVRAPGSGGTRNGGAFMPLDVYEQGDNFQVKASLPGVKPDDVNITVQGNTLTIEGELKDDSSNQGTAHHREHRYGRFYRTISLPAQVNADTAQANFEHGVLTLTLPKVDAARSRQIRVQAGQSTPIDASASQKPELSQPTNGKKAAATA